MEKFGTVYKVAFKPHLNKKTLDKIIAYVIPFIFDGNITMYDIDDVMDVIQEEIEEIAEEDVKLLVEMSDSGIAFIQI